MNHLYHSPHVNWLGDQDQVMDILNDFDVLFFPSYGDTFGLVLVEALFKGKRIVSFVENGMAPFLKNLPGCRVFNQMEETDVLKLIDVVLKEKIDLDKNMALAYELCDVRKLESRLQDLFEQA